MYGQLLKTQQQEQQQQQEETKKQEQEETLESTHKHKQKITKQLLKNVMFMIMKMTVLVIYVII